MASTATNAIPDDDVYTGFWINWSYGRLKGATVTLSHRDGGLLTSFLALFMTIAGRSFWRLFCFAMHLSFSAEAKPQNGLYHQLQAVLRNADTSVVGIHYFVQLLWKWRKKAKKGWLRVLLMTVVTALMTAMFYIASVFTSRVSLRALVFKLACDFHKSGSSKPVSSLTFETRPYD